VTATAPASRAARSSRCARAAARCAFGAGSGRAGHGDDLGEDHLDRHAPGQGQHRLEGAHGQVGSVQRHEHAQLAGGWPGRRGGGRQQDHRDARVSQHVVGDAAVQEATDPAAAMGRHHDQVGVEALGRRDQRRRGADAADQVRLDRQAEDAGPRGRALELEPGRRV
jgi:hypothetical protein